MYPLGAVLLHARLCSVLRYGRFVRTRFLLSFVDESRAREAAAILDRRGFDVHVSGPVGTADEWSVRAVKEIPGPLVSRAMGLTELRLGWLARRLGGKYEGRDVESRK